MPVNNIEVSISNIKIVSTYGGQKVVYTIDYTIDVHWLLIHWEWAFTREPISGLATIETIHTIHQDSKNWEDVLLLNKSEISEELEIFLNK